MAGRTQFVDAVLLRAVDYGDADRIVTFLTADLGKVALMARGARRSRRRFGAALEPCCVVRAEIGEGRGELGRLAQATTVRAFPGILASLGKMTVTGAALELVREATLPREPDRRLFDATVALLEAVERAPGDGTGILVAFEVRVMALVGLAPGFDTCAGCGRRPAPGQSALFDPARGAIACRACGGGPIKLSGDARERLGAAVGWDFAAAAAPPWPPSVLAEARRAVDAFVASHLDRELRGMGQVGRARPEVRRS